MLGQNLSPASIKMKIEQPQQPDQPEGRRDQEARCLAQPQAHRLQAEARGPDQRQAPLQGSGSSSTLEPLLEDLRLRGDRQQLYWHEDRAAVG